MLRAARDAGDDPSNLLVDKLDGMLMEITSLDGRDRLPCGQEGAAFSRVILPGLAMFGIGVVRHIHISSR
jgi:hypothetical protein